MRAHAVLVVLLVATPAAAGAKPIELTLEAQGGGELVLTYDPAKVTEAALRAAAALAPEMGPDALPTGGIDTCRDDAGHSTPCGSAPYTPARPDFFKAAELTLAENRAIVRAATERAVAPELLPAKAWLRRTAAFYAGLEERKLAFYRSWKSAALVAPIEGIDGAKACAAIVQRIDAAATPDAKYALAKHDFHNCMNDLKHQTMGEYPAAPWKAFLKARGVRARRVLQQGD